MITQEKLDSILQRADMFTRYGRHRGEWATAEESFCGPDGDLHVLLADYQRLRAERDAADERTNEKES